MARRRVLATVLCAPLLGSAFLAAGLAGVATVAGFDKPMLESWGTVDRAAFRLGLGDFDPRLLANPTIVMDPETFRLGEFDPRLLANPVIVMDRQTFRLGDFDPRLLANPVIIVDRE